MTLTIEHDLDCVKTACVSFLFSLFSLHFPFLVPGCTVRWLAVQIRGHFFRKSQSGQTDGHTADWLRVCSKRTVGKYMM